MATGTDSLPAIADVSGQDSSDRLLLERFVTHRDEGAFANLVRRYSGAVWGVCRRVLPREQDAEDAFQAVFLVLARKAAAIRKGEAVGSWLYGVAYRTALRARQNAARRQECEKQARTATAEQPPWSEAACRELQRILDEEVHRLAEKYRAPFVLCCLEGLSKAEAARELGWKEGTLSSRLAQARELLRTRLARRGITLTAILTAGALAQGTAAAAPPVMVAATAQAASGTAAFSPSVVALAKGVMNAMALPKLLGMSTLLSMTLAVTAAGLAGLRTAPPPGQPVEGASAPGISGLAAEAFLPRPEPFLTIIDDQVLSLAFSPDGKRLVTAGARHQHPGQLIIWDVATSRKLATVQGIPGVRSVVYSPDGRTLATGDFSGSVRLRDAQTGAERAAVKGHNIGVNAVAFSSDGQSLVSAGLDRIVKLWDVKDLRLRKVFRGHTDQIYSVAFFHHGRGFVTAGRDQTARVWDIESDEAKYILKGHGSGVEAVAISPDDKVVATASWDRTIKLWDAETGKEKATLPASAASIFFIAFSPDGKQLASIAADGTVSVWDWQTRQVTHLGKHAAPAWAVAFSHDGKTLATGSSDRTAKLWNVETKKEIATLDATADQHQSITALVYAPDGKTVGVVTTENVVRIYDATTGKLFLQLRDHSTMVSCLAFTPDGRTLASGSTDQTIKLWDRTGKVIRTLKGHTDTVLALAFSADGKTLASASRDQTIRLWDCTTGKELATLKGHKGAVRALTFTSERMLVSGGDDQTIHVWNLDNKAKPLILKGHTGTVRALACSPDGHTLASASDDRAVKLWDLSTGLERHSLSGHEGAVLTLAFSPTGRTLASGSRDGMVRLWDPRAGKSREVLKGHNGSVSALAFHPAGEHLLSGSHDRIVLRWPAAPSGISPSTLQAHPGGVSFVAYSPAGDWLASGGVNGDVALWTRTLTSAPFPPLARRGLAWDVAFAPNGRLVALANQKGVLLCDTATGEVVRTLPVGQSVRSIAFSPDGQYLAVGTGNVMKQQVPSETWLYEVATGRELVRLLGHTAMTHRVCFSPDGKTLATSSRDRSIRLWEVPSGKPLGTLLGHKAAAPGMVFLPDGTLVSAGFDQTIRFWDVTAKQQKKVWKPGMSLAGLAVSPDGKFLAASQRPIQAKGSTGLLKVWEVSTGKEVRELRGHTGSILALAFTPDGRALLGAGGNEGKFAEISLWNLADGKLLGRHQTQGRWWWERVAISPDGRRVITPSVSGQHYWDVDFLHKRRTWKAHAAGVSCGIFLKQGRLLATGSPDHTIKLWDITQPKPVATLKGHEGAIRGLAVSPDEKTLFSASDDKTIKRWDLTAFTEQATWRGHSQPVTCLAVSADGKTLVSGAGEEMFLWDVDSGKVRQKVDEIEKAIRSVAFSAEGSVVASSASGTIQVHDAATGKRHRSLPATGVGSLAFSTDGKILAAGVAAGGADAVSAWDATSWQWRALLPGKQSQITCLAFSPDGGGLASAGKDGTIKLYPLGPGGKSVLTPGAEKGLLATPGTVSGEPTVQVALDPPLWPRQRLATVLVGLMVLILVGMGALVYIRRRRAPHASTGGETPVRISFGCPNCGKGLKARPELAGKTLRCPHCSKPVSVPAGGAQDTSG